MLFKQSQQYSFDLEEALQYYIQIDTDLALKLLAELAGMESHLSDFPEASPLTSEPPIRKFLLREFPYRIRYAVEGESIILLTMENMSMNHSL